MTYHEFCRKFHLSLNDRQAEAVRSVEGNILLLAVPGSGKTTVLIARLGYLIHVCGIPPENILTMTYTVAATADMSARFASVFGGELAERLEFRTINGVCARIIRLYERSRGTRAFELLTDDRQSASLLAELYRSVTGEFPTENDIKNLRVLITYAKNMQLSAAEMDALEGAPENFTRLYAAYNRQLRERQLMDYDDQMHYALTILHRFPDILDQLRRQYTYICVDEAQDTSKIQHTLISLLAGEDGNLFMVGDEDQSIYRFRAAWPEALVRFEQNRKNAKVLLMETNYRSTEAIISAADRFIQQNTSRHPKHMHGVRGHGAAVQEIPCRDRNGQYAYLRKVAEDCRVETAVLYRDNDCALPLISFLHRNRIPYRCRQVDSSFFTHRVVADITDIILFAADPADGSRFLRIYYKLGTHLSKAIVTAAVRDCPPGTPILDYLIQYGDLYDSTRDCCRDLRQDLRLLLTENGAAAVGRILTTMGYGDFLRSRKLDTNKAEILRAIGYDEPDPLSLLRRLSELEEIVRAGSTDPESRLILSTVHSSKGLEYDRVYLLDVYDGILPPDPAADSAELEEERRIFYVAMTRARNELCIFTFTRRGMASSFCDAVFPKAVPASEPPKHRLLAPLHFGAKKKAAGEERPALHVGDRVSHRKFGSGIVTENLEDHLTVRFDDGRERGFDPKVAMEKGFLRKEEH